MISNSYPKIISTFLDLSSQKTVEKITISELMRKANLQRETFYYYFDSKESLVEETLRSILFEPYLDVLKESTVEDANLNLLNTIQRYSVFFKDLLSPQNEYIFKQIYCRLSVETLANFYSEDGRKSPSDELKFTIKFYAYAVNSIIYEWIQQGFNVDSASLANQFSVIIPNTLITQS